MQTAQATGGDDMVWEMVSWHTLSPLLPIHAAAYLSIADDHMHPYMATINHL